MFQRFLVTIGLVVASLVTVTAQATEPKLVATLSGGLYYAVDGNVMRPATMEEKGSDTTITIFNDDFTVKDQFTLKGVNSYVTKGNGVEEQISGVENCPLYLSIFTGNEIIATRGMFTKDNQWGVIVYNKEKVNDSYWAVAGYYAYSADNKQICELPASTSVTSVIICFSNIFSGIPYYVTYNEVDGSATVWSFDDVNGVVAPQVVAKSVAASPNPLPAGATLKIDLDNEADDNTFLTITDLNGKQVYSKHVRPGEVSVQVSPKFSCGVYIYTVIYGDGETYSGKLAAE